MSASFIIKTIQLESLSATHRIGRQLAPLLRVGDVILLQGDLGVGKSELARAIIQSRAGSTIDVPSPSFTLVQEYDLPDLLITHVDLYRLQDPQEIDELALEDAMAQACLLVEWPERAPQFFPQDALLFELAILPDMDPERRRLVVKAGHGWKDRLLGFW